MKNKLIATLFILTSFTCFAQQKITWKDLSKVKFTKKYYPDYKATFLHPTFSSSVKALEGKQISITGYFLNIDPQENFYILSKGPMASCYFCGTGGPETAIEIEFLSKPSFATDDVITVTGILQLNDQDVEHFNYILSQSKGKRTE